MLDGVFSFSVLHVFEIEQDNSFGFVKVCQGSKDGVFRAEVCFTGIRRAEATGGPK